MKSWHATSCRSLENTWLNKKSDTQTHELSGSIYMLCPEEADPEAEGRFVVAGVGEDQKSVLIVWGFSLSDGIK